MQHPDEGIIHAWLDGALDDAEQGAVEQHVASCAACSAAVAEARGMIAGVSRIVSMLDGVAGGVIPQAPVTPVRTGSRWTALRITPLRAAITAIAASLVIVTATMVGMRYDAATPSPMFAARREVPSADSVATIAPAAPTSAAPTSAASTLAAPTLALEAPAAPRAAAEKTAASLRKAAPPHVSLSDEPSRVVAETKAAPRADSAAAPTSMAPAPAAAPLIASASAFAGAAKRARALPAATSVSASAFVGCYRVAGDSAAWPRLLPARFSLAQADSSAGVEKNVVRFVNADGRVDTAATAGTWRPLTPTTVDVSFTAAHSEKLTLQFSSNGTVLAQGAASGRSTPLMLARGSCRP